MQTEGQLNQCLGSISSQITDTINSIDKDYTMHNDVADVAINLAAVSVPGVTWVINTLCSNVCMSPNSPSHLIDSNLKCYVQLC